jgi:hypothetical protein
MSARLEQLQHGGAEGAESTENGLLERGAPRESADHEKMAVPHSPALSYPDAGKTVEIGVVRIGVVGTSNPTCFALSSPLLCDLRVLCASVSKKAFRLVDQLVRRQREELDVIAGRNAVE